jgi:hypothetical protein
LGAGALVLAVLAGACGGGDDGGGSTAATVDPGVKSGVESATGASSPATPVAEQPTTIEQWEALWAEERAEVVKRP